MMPTQGRSFRASGLPPYYHQCNYFDATIYLGPAPLRASGRPGAPRARPRHADASTTGATNGPAYAFRQLPAMRRIAQECLCRFLTGGRAPTIRWPPRAERIPRKGSRFMMHIEALDELLPFSGTAIGHDFFAAARRSLLDGAIIYDILVDAITRIRHGTPSFTMAVNFHFVSAGRMSRGFLSSYYWRDRASFFNGSRRSQRRAGRRACFQQLAQQPPLPR